MARVLESLSELMRAYDMYVRACKGSNEEAKSFGKFISGALSAKGV